MERSVFQHRPLLFHCQLGSLVHDLYVMLAHWLTLLLLHYVHIVISFNPMWLFQSALFFLKNLNDIHCKNICLKKVSLQPLKISVLWNSSNIKVFLIFNQVAFGLHIHFWCLTWPINKIVSYIGWPLFCRFWGYIILFSLTWYIIVFVLLCGLILHLLHH